MLGGLDPMMEEDDPGGFVESDAEEFGFEEGGGVVGTVDTPEAKWDPLAAADEYLSGTQEQRDARWAELDDDQRDQLRAAGVAGQVTVGDEPPAQSFVTPSDPLFRIEMQRMATEADYGLQRMRSGQLDMNPVGRQRLEALMADAAMYPTDDPRHYEAVQSASRLVDAVEVARADALPTGPSRRTTSWNDNENFYVRERDQRGRVTETVRPLDEVAAEQAALEAEHETVLRPWGDNPTAVTLEDTFKWDDVQTVRFHNEHPDHYERLLSAASLAAEHASWRRKGFLA